MLYKISNVNGTSNRAKLPNGYASWIDYWEKKTGLKAGFCHALCCYDYATDGAHVNVDGYGDAWYIVPLCHAHNMSSKSFYAEGPLVPVNPESDILW